MNSQSRFRYVSLLLALVAIAAIGIWWATTPPRNGGDKPVAAPGPPPADGGRTAPSEVPGEQPGTAGAVAQWESIDKVDTLPGPSETRVTLAAGETIEISCRIERPSLLPANARVLAEWKLLESETPDLVPRGPAEDSKPGRAVDAFGIYSPPTADWSKLLHALDADVYTVYRAPVTGVYALVLQPDEGPVSTFGGTRWREEGKVPELASGTQAAPWPEDAQVDVAVSVRPVDLRLQPQLDLVVEAEPNDTPEQAQDIALRDSNDDYTLHVVGGSDDIEYFDNGRVGSSGDDWFRLDYKGSERRLLTACLSIPDQQVAARVRCYSVEEKRSHADPGQLLPIEEETAGKDPNERGHQQAEGHRLAINRWLDPGTVYLLRVEANAPGYELELRVVEPAPFSDPRKAIRQGMYNHLGQVDAWLMNRPRGASVERRIRDAGNLLGSGCMSCHTQAGVWGPAIAMENGYRPQNVQLLRDLVNICYQSMRPTNHLIDANNNASLAPLDLGDGPAGTRVAGHAAVSIERFRKPRKLQSFQAIRAANNVLQTADPSGVNAAGPGANVGQAVVLNYAGEILWTAWKAAGDTTYFRALEDKARAMLDVTPKFTDDLCHRVELLSRYFPTDYVEAAAKVSEQEKLPSQPRTRAPYEAKPTSPEEAAQLADRIQQQIRDDVARLRAIQNEDGSWGFNPGSPTSEGDGWKIIGANKGEPSPTALALIALQSAGIDDNDQAVAKGIRALLKLQRPTGLWKGESQTGFVSSAYSLQALSRYYPAEPPKYSREDFLPKPGETLLDTIRRVRELSVTEDPQLVSLMLDAADHPSPLVRYWAMIGLGSLHLEVCVEPLVAGLGDRTKMVREAAHWGLRQALIDDHGWAQVLAATQSTDDHVREAAMRALVMRVDGVMPGISVKWEDLTAALARGMNQDPHAGVRAWAARAAWNWWIWNPPVRQAVNQAWIDMLCRPEPDRVAENSLRYQTHALFVANGHHANASSEHQYAELAELMSGLKNVLDEAKEKNPELEARLVGRIVGVAATFYNTAGGDGGPGQMGYSTPGSGELFGTALMSFFQQLETKTPQDTLALQVALEGAANVPYDPLQQQLIHYSLHAPEQLRTIAAGSVSDPRSAKLVAVPERIEPLIRQVLRGADDIPRRPQLSDPIIELFRRVRWMVPKIPEQQVELMGYLVPKFDEYYSVEEIEAMSDPAVRQPAERKMAADWYLAAQLGDVLGGNPDLHFETALDFFPETVQNPLQARFWLPSVPWVLEYNAPQPDFGPQPAISPQTDAVAKYRQRALRLFLDQLTADAEPETRALAVKMAYATPLRSQTEVHDALRAMLGFEMRASVRTMAQKVLTTNRESLIDGLVAAVKKEEPRRVALDAKGEPKLSPEFINDFIFFSDYVTSEMSRPLRDDQRSCFTCHGEAGRVPSLTLKKPDEAGFLTVADKLANYRLLQERINFDDVDRSKLLRKPLNIQTGEEDGHQGGVRYRSDDPGYLLLRKWARHQAEHRDQLGVQPLATAAAAD